MEGTMKYRVHQLEVKRDTAQEKLQSFLNQLDGEVLAIVPYISPTFQLMGATSKVDFLLIIEKSGM
jgi:rhamnose utilization protein RhaD (predicted bifunctional aldolase and dehydrogenase)